MQTVDGRRPGLGPAGTSHTANPHWGLGQRHGEDSMEFLFILRIVYTFCSLVFLITNSGHVSFPESWAPALSLVGGRQGQTGLWAAIADTLTPSLLQGGLQGGLVAQWIFS